MTLIKVIDNTVHIQTGYEHRSRCVSIPGARWNKDAKTWTCSATIYAAQAVLDAFRGTPCKADSAFRELVRQGKAQNEVAEVLRSADSASSLPPIPETRTKPWGHQLRAYHFAYPLTGCCLALDMGTGKSRTTCDLIVNRGHKRTLILAPLSVIQEWPNQFVTHAARKVGVYKPYARKNPLAWDESSPFEKKLIVCPLDDKAGSVKDKLDGARMAYFEAGMNDADVVVVTNYESVWRPPFDDWAMEAGWDCVVADECHRVQAAAGKASRFMSRLGDKVPYRLGLTGTPFSSGPLSIYGQYRFLDKSIFGTSNKHFKQHYARMGGFQQHQVVGYQNESELQRKFYSIAFRVESRDVLDLPDEQHIRRYFTLPPATMRAYKELETILVTQIKEGEITVSNALVKLLRLQQITSGFARVDPTDDDEGKIVRIDSEKENLLADILTDLDRREPIVVFARFTHDLEAVKSVCDKQGRTCAFLDGSRKQTEEWRNGEYDVLAVQIKAGGVGINLTRSHTCVYFSIGYSLSDYQQSLARTMRPGQTNKVVYYHLVAENSVDCKVYDALQLKEDVVKSILEGYSHVENN